MPITTYGKQRIAVRIGSNTDIIGCIAIGMSGGTATVDNIALGSEFDRNKLTGSIDMTASRKLTFIGDYASTEVSGLNLREFGLFVSGAAGVGSLWERESFNAINFNGQNELRIESSWEVI
jgi:hypothetical protein